MYNIDIVDTTKRQLCFDNNIKKILEKNIVDIVDKKKNACINCATKIVTKCTDIAKGQVESAASNCQKVWSWLSNSGIVLTTEPYNGYTQTECETEKYSFFEML